MIYASVCSGIEGASVAFSTPPLNWKPAWFAEIEPFCCELLKYRYPEVENRGDFTKIKTSEPLDLLIGGTPCQSFSVAGKRAGIYDPRGNLTLEFLALVDRLKPRWIIWENVFGILSIDNGRTFGTIIGTLGECGFGVAYRVLDAQYFGVPQRRRRVFVVGCLDGWRSSAAVLFEPESLSGNPKTGKAKRKEVAGTIGGGSGSRGWCSDTDRMTFVPQTAHAVAARDYKGVRPEADACDAIVVGPLTRASSVGGTMTQQDVQSGHVFSIRLAQTSSNGWGINEEGTSYTLDGTQGQAIAYGKAKSLNANSGRNQIESNYVPASVGVRRLTPEECEALQGFPRGWTAIPYRGKEVAADGNRYKSIGNSFAVPVVRWLGKRIQMVEDIGKC